MEKQLTFSSINTQGRLGNNLFEIASCYGLARRSGRQFVLPEWRYTKYFQWSKEIGQGYYPWLEPVREMYFQYCGNHFDRELASPKRVIDVLGWLQSEKYFSNYASEIRQIFAWKPEFLKSVVEPVKELFQKPVIALHVRRGDYVNNPNYHNLPPIYYIAALDKFFPGWAEDTNILVFSDDIPWCKTYFSGQNIYFSEGRSDIEDLCLLSQCKNFILSNSSFSWWGAWLANTKGIIVRPSQYFEGDLKKWNNTKDFWMAGAIEFNYVGHRIPLNDVTFTIPVFYDHPDREVNLARAVKYIRRSFQTNIIIGEQGGQKFSTGAGYTYMFFHNMRYFHRTKMLNEMALKATTPIVVNYDADVIIPLIQLLQATYLCRRGVGMVYPYDGRFVRIPKDKHSLPLHELNINILPGGAPNATKSSGGCMMFLKSEYIKGGMENEHFISYGVEDSEIHERMGRVGVDIRRVKGPLYHYDHFIGINSSHANPFWEANIEELERIRAMSNHRLKEYVNSWVWKKKATN